MQREGPPDWEAVFHGNIDGVCEIGVAVRVDRQSIAVDFFAGTRSRSDLIVATPLALRLAAEGSPGRPGPIVIRKVLVMDQADVLLYQTGRPWNDV